METLLHPAPRDFKLPGVLYALGDPIRLEIVRCLAHSGGVCCAGLSQQLPKSTLTRHFRVLRENGVIMQQRNGRQCLNTLRRDDLEARFPGLLDTVLAASEMDSTSK
jgi:DNA-binding transcriptional ArsR family regulator